MECDMLDVTACFQRVMVRVYQQKNSPASQTETGLFSHQ
jgi:hypothetical protein